MKKFKYKKGDVDLFIKQYKENCFNWKKEIDELYLKIGKHAIIVLECEERMKKFGEKVHEKSENKKKEKLNEKK